MNIFYWLLNPKKALRIKRVTDRARVALKDGKNGLWALVLAWAHDLPDNDEFVCVVHRLAESESFVENRHPFDNMLNGHFKESEWLDAFKKLVAHYAGSPRLTLDFGERDYDEWADLTEYMISVEYERRIVVNSDVDVLVKQAEGYLSELELMTQRESEMYGRLRLIRGVIWNLSKTLK